MIIFTFYVPSMLRLSRENNVRTIVRRHCIVSDVALRGNTLVVYFKNAMAEQLSLYTLP